MATTNSLVTLSLLQYYDGKIKQVIADGDAPAIKSVAYDSNTLYFFTDKTVPSAVGDYATKAVFSFNLPEEQFLDHVNTKLIDSFTYDATVYPNTTDPNLDGKPVLVLAVKGDTDVSYSFVNLEKLIDIYTGETTDTVAVTVSADNKISATVKISADADNSIVAKSDGLYVPTVTLTYAQDSDIDALF